MHLQWSCTWIKLKELRISVTDTEAPSMYAAEAQTDRHQDLPTSLMRHVEADNDSPFSETNGEVSDLNLSLL